MDPISIVVGIVIVVVFATILAVIATHKKGGSKKSKGRAQIIREASRKLSQDPHNPEGLIALGDIYFNEHTWEKAYSIYDTMMAVAPAHPEIDPFTASLRQGICAIKTGKIQEAFKGLGAAYQINPNHFEVNYYLGLACFKNKEYEKSVPCFKKALVIRSEASEVNSYLGLALYYGRHFKESLVFLKRALDENPENKEALFSMADAMAESGYGDKALKVFMHLRPDPEFGARSCLQGGIIHLRTNQFDKAIQDFEIGLKHPDVPQEILLELKYRLANAYFATEKIANGLAALKDITAIIPSYKDVQSLLSRYQELNQNKNLQVYLMANSSDFVTLCRKIVMTYYQNAVTRIQDISVTPGSVEILVTVETARWEDTEVFRFYRTTGSTGELAVRDFNAKVNESKADRGICFAAGPYTEEARHFAEGRPVDLVAKEGLIRILKKIDNI